MKCNRLLGICLFFSVLTFTMISCTAEQEAQEQQTSMDDDVQEHSGIYTGGATTVDGHTWSGWYTDVTCEPKSGDVKVLKAFYDDRDVCWCEYRKWEAANCESDGLGGGSGACKEASRAEKPSSMLCQD